MIFVLDIFRRDMMSDLTLIFLYLCLVEIKHGRLINWSQSFLETISLTQSNRLQSFVINYKVLKQLVELTSIWNLTRIIKY